ncbi:MAG: hypothetical protein A3H70_02535 [Candidatus Komeilibacteria bacterium RIFCSPLOWO2_02_FULL_48_11]|uniref:Response regulatory domain-containing protein n=1 Tax=Candidatus Komeilibacteria bacterium RIFCSPLOWO2_02_FULL_48_11 TaxID=1798553 RepID=A0A1G2BQ23_9BACT|nr:MAG: hypothetical protein A3H70_02535 [Candidatus Komeilibacteria bacterium RIFCSPLOWO2_02_FULL_48_11]
MNNAKNPIVLLVEDDLFLQRMYAAKLAKEGLNALTAVDGEKALALMSETVPAVVLLDILMPKKDGFAVLEAMRADERLKDVPVVLLTNLGEQEDVKRARRLGANEYLIKAHFLPSEVIGVVKKYIK